ncbi:DUF4065 domain-containing protein [Candidatus Saccharibacteria bacterium]|nr:DUF4065 domain-containing protein [Candidatus Saccharibacteria bacterium]
MDKSGLIKKLREDANLTQQEVANELGLARATYAAIEDGREPKLSVIKDLAEFYQIAPGDLIEGKITVESFVAEPAVEYKKEEAKPRDEFPTLKPNKLRDVILYLTEKISAKPNVGETVIYKLLYFIDFDYYEKTGQSITGMTYVKNYFGPTPAAMEFFKVIDKMKLAEELEVAKTKYFGHDQKKYLPLVKSDLASLSAAELEHINWEIERLGDKSATELSELSHYDTPWVVAEMGKPIKYRFVFYRGDKTAVTEPEDEL